MSYKYDTRLVCKSNGKLLQKIEPNKIIKDLNSEFLFYEKGAYHFTTRNGTMHGSIVALSNKYPEEIFIAQFWMIESYDSGWELVQIGVPDGNLVPVMFRQRLHEPA